MSTSAKPLSQSIKDEHVRTESKPGRGNGLVATGDFGPGEQILFIQRPLMFALEPARLKDKCYHCLAAEEASSNEFSESERISLKFCSGCKTVKFCGKTCQTLAWRQYHKFECKLFGTLHPRVLPTPARAVIRLLKQRQAGILPSKDWDRILTLESHQDDFSNAGGQHWQDLFLMVKAIKTYAGSNESPDTILRLYCILLVNSFTLTTFVSDTLGVIFHPLSALINHSCTPNAIVRFDVPATAAPSRSAERSICGTISVNALHPIPRTDEITISYTDLTFPFAKRQSDLKSRYFFNCACPLCLKGIDSWTDHFLGNSQPENIDTMKMQEEAEQILLACQSRPVREPASIKLLKGAMTRLSQSKIWPLHRYPYPQLRYQLNQSLLANGRFTEALGHAAILVRRVDPVRFMPGGSIEGERNPTRITNVFSLYMMIRFLLISMPPNPPRETAYIYDKRLLPLAACYLVAELVKTTYIISGKDIVAARDASSSESAAAIKSKITPTMATGAFENRIYFAMTDLTQTKTGSGRQNLWGDFNRPAQRAAHERDVERWLDDIISRVLAAEDKND